jgi:hypothetical protein
MTTTTTKKNRVPFSMMITGGNRRKTKRRTVDEIAETLVNLSKELDDFSREKEGHLNRINTEISQLNAALAEATSEKEKSDRIKKNVDDILFR